ncbi:MAG TPA: hypothetical protein DIT13_02260 [Verrucomicrobiales bacterium]|nr:hypothetical protein [Verrucomicrobiales bacterium]HRJ09516.1 hypothetical protein [Prosthecobacter sp.]HRK15017.1 hypothetical protein [Prosthecobacter sp.]
MNLRDSIFAHLWLLLALPVMAASPAGQAVVGRTVYHPDNSRTETVRDMNVREMTETTYNSANALISKKVFLLNEKGEPLQGNIYDGRGNLVARAQCLYDEFGRRKEDRLSNMKGELFQRIVHEYDASGKALKPKVMNLSQSPTIRPAAIDFTTPPGGVPAGVSPDAGSPSSRFAPTQIPASSQQPASTPSSGPKEEKKPNFFRRLFKKE